MATDKRFDDSITRWLEATAPAGLPERVLSVTFDRTRGSRQRRGWRAFVTRPDATRPALALALGLGAVTVVVLGAVLTAGAPKPTDDPRSPFLGIWISTSDSDGGTETMTVRTSGDGAVDVVVIDDIAAVCSHTPSTMTGTGRLEGSTTLVIPAPVYTCDDGSEPKVLSGDVPLDEQLRDLTYVHDPASDVLTIGVGFSSVWRREGAETNEPVAGLDSPESWHRSEFPGSWESGAADTGFLGTWEATDVDGSSLLLGVRVAEAASDTFEVLLLDDRAGGGRRTWPESDWPNGICNGGPGTPGPVTMTGIGRTEGRELAIGSQTWLCEPAPGAPGPDVVTGDRGIDLKNAYAPLVHDPGTDTLVGPAELVWHRRPAGSDPIAVPFWGVWPQSTLPEAEEAQRRADAGDPAFTWQLAPELANPPEWESFPPAQDAADRAEILDRFFRDRLGWEQYKTVARRNPGRGFSDGLAWSFVRIRCGPGTNPLYPNDGNGGACPPTIDDTHYETVEVTVMQPVLSGPPGIWVVTGWTELDPSEEPTIDLKYESGSRQYEQVVPPSKAEVVEALEAFLSARVAGEGAEAYLTEGYAYSSSPPTVPLLYATTKGDRYERFEIVSVQEQPDWPAGDYGVDVRLFARGGEDVVEQAIQVWPGSRGRLSMDSSITTDNGVPVPDRLGSEE